MRVQAGEEIVFDETHLHYGKGQTEAAITLTPGKHKLTLQFANALHKRRANRHWHAAHACAACIACADAVLRSYGKGYAKQISITVK